MRALYFTKIHSNGNDFVLLDRIAHHIADNLILEHMRYLCDRHKGIGCDGVLIVDPPLHPKVDFNYRILNASGEEVCQCGNGAICFGHYISSQDYSLHSTISVELCGRRMFLTKQKYGKMTLLDMGAPSFDPAIIPTGLAHPDQWTSLEIAGQTVRVSAVSMGNPHLVILVDAVDTADVLRIGEAFQHHALFPEQVNVGFMEIIDRSNIRLRIFERGVGETLSCGSGACAAVVIGQWHGLLAQEVTVNSLGGQAIVSWDTQQSSSVFYASSAHIVYSGKFYLESNNST